MSDKREVFSPVSGQIIPLTQVPDPVFSEKMLGDGVAVDPSDNTVYAPFDGTITNFNSHLHAVTFSNGETEVLIHVGLETIALKGQGFQAFAHEGDDVKKGQKILTFDKDLIAQNAPCSWVMCVLTAPADTPVTPAAGQVEHGARLFWVGDNAPAPEPQAQTPAGKTFSAAPIAIINPNGVHARPAGVLAQAAKKFPFKITLSKGDKTADAKSVVGIMGLALGFGEQVVLSAQSDDAQAAQTALDTLSALIAAGCGENTAAPAPKPAVAPDALPVKAAPLGTPIKGLTACNGLAEGKTFLFKHEEVTFEENAQDAAAEKQLFEDCLLVLSERLKEENQNAPSENARTIAAAHLEMLQDPFLTQETLAVIQMGKTAAYSFNEAIRKSIDLLRQTGSTFLAERIADFKDLRRKMILLLNGQEETSYKFEQDTILLAEELLPSDVTHCKDGVRGVVLTDGSPTAHVSILLRNKNIPTLVNTRVSFDQVPNGTPAFIDADQATVLLAPNEKERQALHARFTRACEEEKQNRANRLLPAVTTDGVKVEIGGNINSAADAKTAFENGADGLGLVRTEFLFLRELTAPAEQKQASEYQAIVQALQGKPVTLRTLDIGGDKPVRYISIPAEENPMLGMRGVRLYDENETIFRTQVRAMLQVKPLTALRIMIPMIGATAEMHHMRQIIEEEKQKLGISAPVQIGMMVEIPAAALMAEQFAQEADFFSLGTNDLTQYALAIDRGHKMLSPQADGLSPAVLRLIDLTCQGAQKYNRHVAVCGALAGDLQAVPLLIGLGVRELAVGAGAIAQVKALVRRLSFADCQKAAKHALTLGGAAAVREFVRQTFH